MFGFVWFFFFPLQREEALKQRKELSQELVNLRGELGKCLFLYPSLEQKRSKTDLRKDRCPGVVMAGI